MKKFLISFLKVIGIILASIGICAFSAIRIQKFDRGTNVQRYQKIAVEKLVDESKKIEKENTIIVLNTENPVKTKQKLNDWRLVLVNFENELPEDFEVELANVDKTRQFDKRAIDELNQLIKDAKKARIGNLWVQSAYRSIEKQEELFNNKVEEYLRYGKTQEEAEELTKQYINKSNTSEHNLGLAVDFNYVKADFEKSPAFAWLNEHASQYGFILRYRKDKEEITGVSYEPWHWRYVGVEHAEKINELDMCLEEYVEYLENNN